MELRVAEACGLSWRIMGLGNIKGSYYHSHKGSFTDFYKSSIKVLAPISTATLFVTLVTKSHRPSVGLLPHMHHEVSEC